MKLTFAILFIALSLPAQLSLTNNAEAEWRVARLSITNQPVIRYDLPESHPTYSVQTNYTARRSVNTMAKESNRQERARNIQHFGEPDTSWMLTNAGWMRKRSQAMVATNQWNRPVSVKLVPPEIVPPEAPARAVAAKHSHYVSHHYRTRSAWVFEGARMTKRGKPRLLTLTAPKDVTISVLKLPVMINGQRQVATHPRLTFSPTVMANLGSNVVFDVVAYRNGERFATWGRMSTTVPVVTLCAFGVSDKMCDALSYQVTILKP